MKKTFSLIFAVLLLLSTLAGCAQTATTPTTNDAQVKDTPVDTPADSTEPEVPATSDEAANIYDANGRIAGASLPSAISFPLAEQKTYTIFASNYTTTTFNYIDSIAENLFYQEMAERTNITFEFDSPVGAASEQFSLMMASEDYPNVIRTFQMHYNMGIDHAIEEGIIWALEDYADYYPNYQAIRDAREDIRMDTISDEGHVWGFSTIMTEEQGAWWGPMIRSDLLEKYNLDTPVTFADWEEVFEAFKQEPGMENGVFLMPSSFFSFWNSWTGAFDCGSLYSFNNQEGTVAFSALTDGYKEAVTLMHDWWEKGYIYKDFLNANTLDLVGSGNVGIWEFAYDLSPFQAIFDPTSGWDVMPIASPLKEVGQETHFRQCQPMASTANSDVITTVTSEEDMKILCAFTDQFYTREVGQLANWGVEGLTFNYDENGEPVYTDLITNNPEGMTFLGANEVYLGGRNMSGLYEWTREITSEGTQMCLDAWSSAGCDWVFPSAATMNAEENYEFAAIMSDIQTFIEENVAAFVFGDKDIDTEWNAFIETIYSMDIETAIELKQNQLDRYYGRLN